jgi:NADP-dependent 3-hydroxy acid dehydrogenase YdfG
LNSKYCRIFQNISPNVPQNRLSWCAQFSVFTVSVRLTRTAVSGANRGIGYGLAAALAARPNTIVFAGARDPAAQSLKNLVAKHPNVHPIKLTSGDEADNAAAAAEIQKIAGHIDVLIANAGTRHVVCAQINY